jgi:hypothetical protein
LDVRFGPKPVFALCPRHFRFSLNSDQIADIA